MPKERASANTPALSRRTLLTALPASGMALALPAVAEPVDPIMPLYHEWYHARADWLRLADIVDDWDTEPMLTLWDRRFAAFEKLGDMTPCTMAGIAALADVLWKENGPHCRPDQPGFAELCSLPENKLISAIWKAASGKTGVPVWGV